MALVISFSMFWVKLRLDESELDERRSDTDGANEKAHERGRVGGVRDTLCDCLGFAAAT